MTNAVGCRILPDRLGRGLDEIDARGKARTGGWRDEIAQVMVENSSSSKIYTMSLMAMVFTQYLLTGLFGVNLGGIPGGGWQFGFSIFVFC